MGPEFPGYEDIEGPLLQELRRRGGSARPSDRDRQGRSVYDALADNFQLSVEARGAVIYENGVARSKWENMVRWARRKLVDRGLLVKDLHGVWKINE